MHFALTEEQEALAAAVRALVERRAKTMDARAAASTPAGYDEQLWHQLSTQIGAAALAVPEEYGGAGYGLFETHLVLQELGAALTPSPLLGSGVLATQAILLAGDRPAAERLLPGLAVGVQVAALAWADRSGRWRTDGSDVTATPAADRWQLTGEARLLLGDRADVLLAVANTDDGAPALFELAQDADVTWTPTPGVDPLLRFATVRFDAAEARPLTLAAGPALVRLADVAAVAVTAIQVGAAGAALERTRRYLLEREQFGRPLGSFQALKHRMADLLVLVETARSVSWAAAWAAARDEPLERPAAVAKAWCTDAFNQVAAETVQLHGGIAITWEHDAQLYFKRAHATAQLFGRAHEHRRRLLDHL